MSFIGLLIASHLFAGAGCCGLDSDEKFYNVHNDTDVTLNISCGDRTTLGVLPEQRAVCQSFVIRAMTTAGSERELSVRGTADVVCTTPDPATLDDHMCGGPVCSSISISLNDQGDLQLNSLRSPIETQADMSPLDLRSPEEGGASR